MNGTLTPVAPAQKGEPLTVPVVIVPIEVTFPVRLKSSILIDPVRVPPNVITTVTVPVNPFAGLDTANDPVLVPLVGIVPEPTEMPLIVILHVLVA